MFIQDFAKIIRNQTVHKSCQLAKFWVVVVGTKLSEIKGWQNAETSLLYISLLVMPGVELTAKNNKKSFDWTGTDSAAAKASIIQIPFEELNIILSSKNFTVFSGRLEYWILNCYFIRIWEARNWTHNCKWVVKSAANFKNCFRQHWKKIFLRQF